MPCDVTQFYDILALSMAPAWQNGTGWGGSMPYAILPSVLPLQQTGHWCSAEVLQLDPAKVLVALLLFAAKGCFVTTATH